jgi:signal transduction histidine kinase
MTGFERKRRRSIVRLPSRRRKPALPVPVSPKVESSLPNDLSFTEVLHKCAAVGIVLLNAQKEVAAINDHARGLLDLKAAPDALPTFASLPGALRAVARRALARKAEPLDQRIEISDAARGPIVLHVTSLPVRESRKGAGAVLVLNELTPALQIEQHVLQLDRLASIGTLAAGMAHEIKNALVAGKTFVDLLLEKHQDAELVEVVRREMGRIDALVSRMRNFAGPARPAFRDVRLHEVLEHSLRLIQPQLEDKLIVVNRSFLAASDLLRGDDYQLQQAFVNLFLNALDAMGANGTLSVATNLLTDELAAPGSAKAPARPQIQLTVQDNGHGISAEHMARLFDPFFTTKPTGTGLGLPITRRIIHEHHGAITVQSQPNQGTSFQILLPVSA